MSQAGIPIISDITGFIGGGKSKEQQLAEEQMRIQKEQMDRLNAERLAKEQQDKETDVARAARRRQKAESTGGTSRADTILTSPLGNVSSGNTAKKTILGG